MFRTVALRMDSVGELRGDKQYVIALYCRVEADAQNFVRKLGCSCIRNYKGGAALLCHGIFH